MSTFIRNNHIDNRHDSAISKTKQRKRFCANSRLVFHNSKTTNLAESYNDLSSSYEGPSNYIKRISENLYRKVDSKFSQSVKLPSRTQCNFLDRISRRSAEPRKTESENSSIIKLHNNTFQCPKIIKAVPSVLPNQSDYINQNPVKNHIQKNKQSFRRDAVPSLVLDKVIKLKPVVIEDKVKYKNSYSSMTKPREENFARGIKIIVESEGTVKTKSTMEMRKDYEISVCKNKMYKE